MRYVEIQQFYTFNFRSLLYLLSINDEGIIVFFQYLRLRFNSTVRLFGTIIFILKLMLYIPIVIYVPALAFSQGTISIIFMLYTY